MRTDISAGFWGFENREPIIARVVVGSFIRQEQGFISVRRTLILTVDEGESVAEPKCMSEAIQFAVEQFITLTNQP